MSHDTDPTALAPDVTAPAPTVLGSRRVLRRWWRAGLVVVGAAVAALALHGRFPAWSSIWAALFHASPAWIAFGFALELVSMIAFAEQQRRFLGALGVRMRARTSLAVTYVRSAMSISLPAGSAVSAAYAFRQFRARGADNGVATAVMVLHGVSSVVGLAVLYAVDVLAWAGPGMSRWPALAIGGAILVALGGVAVWARSMRAKIAQVAPARATLLGRTLETVRGAVRLSATVTVRQWLVVGGLAVVNWLADAACLLVGVRAVGLTVPALTLLTAYLAVQLIRQVPVTPGGVGIIEASLLVALTAAGAPQAPAAAAVLIYRVLSCWSILPIGLACWTAQQTGGARERGLPSGRGPE
jgi:uncharacterized protein (TIRG00374 family)